MVDIEEHEDHVMCVVFFFSSRRRHTRSKRDSSSDVCSSDLNGKPSVAVFSTPLLCQSQLCGPVTDEVLLVYEQVGKDRANFIHVEEFLPGPDLEPDASKRSEERRVGTERRSA